jgi:ribosome biogenesis GTPase / thiamine phosphate phosphatase
MNLQDLGWDAAFAHAFRSHADDGLIPARVAVRHHGPYELLCERGRLAGIAAGRLEEQELPAVGDWVAARALPGERRARAAPTFGDRAQGSLTPDGGPGRGGQPRHGVPGHGLRPRSQRPPLGALPHRRLGQRGSPVIAVNKRDLAEDAEARLAEVECVAAGAPVHAVSAATGDGLEQLLGYLGRGRTIALLGSSGVGKSTLVNRLAGQALLASSPTRADGRGRHRTTHRELVPLPSGGLLIDTPGMRELGLWVEEEALERTFTDVADVGPCRFSDCSHDHEPGCAVQAALADGSLSADRLASYRKLLRELRALEVRRDARLRAEARRELRRFSRRLRERR